MHKEREGVYAILRYDGFHGPDTRPEATVTVKEIVRSQELAEAEVARLNALAEGREVRYWWQYTRLYPEGRSAGSVPPDSCQAAGSVNDGASDQ